MGRGFRASGMAAGLLAAVLLLVCAGSTAGECGGAPRYTPSLRPAPVYQVGALARRWPRLRPVGTGHLRSEV